MIEFRDRPTVASWPLHSQQGEFARLVDRAEALRLAASDGELSPIEAYEHELLERELTWLGNVIRERRKYLVAQGITLSDEPQPRPQP